MAGRIVDIFLVYQFLKRLATPFNKWKAYELGIIDDEGKVLKKRKDLETQEEKNAWGYYDILVANLKKLIGQVPFGKTRIASLAAAALLLREYKEEDKRDPEDINLIEERFNLYFEKALTESLEEEVPANNAGQGNIAGIGVGAKGEPGVMPRAQKKYKNKNEQEQDRLVRAVRGMV